MSAILVENLQKDYDNKQILSGINMEVLQNDIYGLIGLNGIGKTTLIRVLLNIAKADGGQVKIFGNILEKNKNTSKKICYLPEKFTPSPELTGLELIKTLGGFHKKSVNLHDVGKWCEKFEFKTDYLHKRIRSYSKGMVQKIGLIATFISNAKLFILDEPMSGLDFRARNILKSEILNLQKRGATVFFTSHVLADIEQICTRVGVLNNKKIVFEGKLKDLTKKHKNIEEAVINLC